MLCVCVVNDYLLVVAGSGRLLAQAARQSGLIPLVVDLYGDLDTRSFAEAVLQVKALNLQNLKAAIGYFKDRYAFARAIYGSGLERVPECVKFLEQQFDLVGNDAATFRLILDKANFFALLARLGIPYPEVTFSLPQKPGRWLVKPLQGEGGVGIRRFAGLLPDDNAVYWQKMLRGISGSVLFLADGRSFQVLGFNTQASITLDSQNEFVFAGIINKSPLSREQEQRVSRWLDVLVCRYGLKGLNTLDFIVQGEAVFVLEINPRPSASMQLYDGDMLRRHEQACRGRLEHTGSRSEGYCGYRLVYADRDWQIPESLPWPESCVDLPAPGLVIGKGQPICSMIARAESPRQVFERLRATEQIIVNYLKAGHFHYGIYSEH
ncbi:MAG: ATP-dependent carboxylate-amine ligase [Gammaproteobacteria bacterium HGW-Gammaproteobacteria-3]|nr:MAG: ATP-dependent carboxylate-amine ligase [Gammaproteobacteria bacterium HGW-Gammaproteobacteria-3]